MQARPTRTIRKALAFVCFLLLGVALGVYHHARQVEALGRRLPVEQTRVSLEALVLLRQGDDAAATAVLEDHLRRTVRALRREPESAVNRLVLEQAEELLDEARRLEAGDAGTAARRGGGR